MTMMSLRRVLPIRPDRLARVPSAAALLMITSAAFGQTAPAVSTIVAFNLSVPSGGVVMGTTDGALYGTGTSRTIVSGGVVYRATRDGLSVKTLHQFQGSEGSTPAAGVIEGSDGLLYGSTSYGAADQAYSTGTIYRLKKDGTDFTVLYRFASYTTVNVVNMPVNTDGARPESQLLEGSDGNLYGVTAAGGANGTGVVFRMTMDGTAFQLLHEFGAVTSSATDSVIKNDDGVTPVGRLLQAPDGYLYGTTSNGGVDGRGVIFRVHMDGSGFEVVHQFPALSSGSPAINVDGARPVGGLTDGQNGLLYGIANLGGANGVGTLYSLDPNSLLLTVLHDFDAPEGAFPAGGLTLALDGRLYGTTQGGGTNSSGAETTAGTIFSVALDGTGFTKHYSFDGSQGASPNTRLLQLDDTTFAGVTPSGGACSQGTLYSFSLTGATVVGNTTCGQKKKNKSGGGATDPLVVLIGAALGLVSRRRRG
ncbi:MAG TPA: hypothetical protein PL152_05535 [Steroidobacteraceae bacterium]|nr:hypothetical protein [Steroidobacteraceae bacterium]